jgi:hypothetical protein
MSHAQAASRRWLIPTASGLLTLCSTAREACRHWRRVQECESTKSRITWECCGRRGWSRLRSKVDSSSTPYRLTSRSLSEMIASERSTSVAVSSIWFSRRCRHRLNADLALSSRADNCTNVPAVIEHACRFLRQSRGSASVFKRTLVAAATNWIQIHAQDRMDRLSNVGRKDSLPAPAYLRFESPHCLFPIVFAR